MVAKNEMKNWRREGSEKGLRKCPSFRRGGSAETRKKRELEYFRKKIAYVNQRWRNEGSATRKRRVRDGHLKGGAEEKKGGGKIASSSKSKPKKKGPPRAMGVRMEGGGRLILKEKGADRVGGGKGGEKSYIRDSRGRRDFLRESPWGKKHRKKEGGRGRNYPELKLLAKAKTEVPCRPVVDLYQHSQEKIAFEASF